MSHRRLPLGRPPVATRVRLRQTGVAVALLSASSVFAYCSHPSVGGPSVGGTGSSDGGTPGSGGSNPMGGAGGPGGSGGADLGSVAECDFMGTDSCPPAPTAVCGDASYKDKFMPGYTQDPALLTKVQAKAQSLTVPQLKTQMTGLPNTGNNWWQIFQSQDDTSAQLRGFKYLDGPRGANFNAINPDTSGGPGYSTAFPVAIGRGAAFDLDLEYDIGAAIGDETLAVGWTMTLAPTINILRHPAWGRAQETYGEDVYQLGRLGGAFVAGAQQYIPACAKHYAANNIEIQRGQQNALMDEQTLREIYGRHFEMVVRDAGVSCVMASYNKVNNLNNTQNGHLLTDILRKDFGFKGIVISDWWAMPPGGGSPSAADNVSTSTRQQTAAQAITAGLDVELPWRIFYDQIESIVDTANGVPKATLVESTKRILEQKYRFNLADLGVAQFGLKKPKTSVGAGYNIQNNADHIVLAYQAALESMTLLKNDDNTLPIPATAKTVAVLGAAVDFDTSGAVIQAGTVNFATGKIAIKRGSISGTAQGLLGDLGSSRVFADPAKSTGPYDGLTKSAPTGVKVITSSSSDQAAILAAADQADFIVFNAGLTPQDEGEEYTMAGDRASFALDAKRGGTSQQNTLISMLAAKNKPMVVVLYGGSVIDMPWLDKVKAVVMAWYPGQDGGHALGDLLFGKANFGGKLPITWPKAWADEPPFASGVSIMMDYDLGYRYFDRKGIAPLFPFGHGLSYTTFKYENLQIPCAAESKNGVLNVRVDVTNTGTAAGDETVFVFASYPDTKGRRSIKELKGFYKVKGLQAGHTRRVTIPLRIADLKYWNKPDATGTWEVEVGNVQLAVGPSSANLPLKGMFAVK